MTKSPSPVAHVDLVKIPAELSANGHFDPESLHQLVVEMTKPSQIGGRAAAERMIRLLNDVLADPQTVAQLDALHNARRDQWGVVKSLVN